MIQETIQITSRVLRYLMYSNTLLIEYNYLLQVRKTILKILHTLRGVKKLGLKIRRKMAGLSQKTVATSLGTTRVSVARWELGTHEPNFEALRKLSQLYDCSIDDLLRCEDDE